MNLPLFLLTHKLAPVAAGRLHVSKSGQSQLLHSLGQRPILLPSAKRTACEIRRSTTSRARKLPRLTLQLEMMSTTVTAMAFGLQTPFLFHHLSSRPRKMKTQS